MSRDALDGQIEGQMTLADLYQPPERLFAVSRIFARARKMMTLNEQKAFVYALSELRFTEEAKSASVRLDKGTLNEILGLKNDADHLSQNVYDEIKDLWRHSHIEIADRDLDLYSSGCVVASVTKYKNIFKITFNTEYLPLFTGLSTDYITMWSMDIFRMTNRRSVQFYEYLRQITDTRESTHDVGLGVKALKELFDIPKDGPGSYMRENGHFDRTSFERRIIDPICADLARCRMITLTPQPDGRLYAKIKQGGRVLGYRFFWTYTDRPGVASADEVAQLQERVDKNPRVLKVAKDIVEGDKKKSKKPTSGKKEEWKDFEQREYDFEELERKLLED